MIRGLNPDTVITDEVSMSAFSKQEGGNHYTKMKIQPFQYSMANGLDPMQHTVIKYVTRFRDKGGVADLKKAIHTLELLIEHEELKKAEHSKLTGDMRDGVVPVHIIASCYGEAQNLALREGWPVWTYHPLTFLNFKKFSGRLFVATGRVTLTDEQLHDLLNSTNILMFLD